MIEREHFTALPVVVAVPLAATGYAQTAVSLVALAYGWLFVIARFERGERDVDC